MAGRKLIVAALIFTFFALGGLLVGLKKVKINNEKEEKMEKNLLVRLPSVAGQFYPYDEGELRAMGERFLAAAEKKRSDFPLILIVPHAGWEFSGPLAAIAFAQIKGGPFTKVILLGPSHYAFFSGAAIDGADFWQTPLGRVKVDHELASQLLAPEKGIVVNSQVHEKEHCLEVELPFLQMVLPHFQIVPILVSQKDEEAFKLLAQRISARMAEDEKILLVVSSDLSHYPDMSTAQEVDERMIRAILTADEKKFSYVLSQLANEYSWVDTFACGQEAIRIGLQVAQNLGIRKGELLGKTNSGEVTGQTDRVVGYAAIGFYGSKTKVQDQKPEEEKELNKSQQRLLLQIARQTLENYLQGKEPPEIEVTDEALKQKRGVFVTLKKNGRLRGCIGSFFPQKPLYQEVAAMAISAAVDDHRFPPLRFDELGEIKIEISVLSPLRRVTSWEEIELGKHGVYLQYGGRTATFLPQVAEETGWSREEFLAQLCAQKAGLPPDCYRYPQTKLFVYTAQVFSEEDN